MYFNQFPKIYYDFPESSGDTSLQILTDITTNVRVRKAVLENITLYDEYDMLEGETPEMVAEKVYGNPELHWIIMLANQRYDYLKDFPMSSKELHNYIVDKYGIDNIDKVHHYEKDGIVVEARAYMKIPKATITELKVNDFILDDPIGNARIDYIDLATNTVNVLVDYGSFSAGKLITVRGIREVNNKLVYTAVANYVVPANGFVVADGYVPISNYAYEMKVNEKKRRIKLISSSLIEQIVKEFQSLVTP